MEKRLAILIGIQGSGKSTFYRRYLEGEYTRVNLDTLKTRFRERLLIDECLASGTSLAIDNTNPTKADRQRYIPYAKEAGYTIICYFIESKLKPCMERNAQRQGKERIPDCAIISTSNKLEMPSYDEGFDEIYFVKNDGKNMIIEEWRDV